MKCQYCGSEAVLPFRCPFCGGYFCTEHRLPEVHGCPEVSKALRKGNEQQPGVEDALGSQGQYYDYRVPISRSRWKNLGVSATELKHLTIGTLVVFGVGFSIFLQEFRLSGYGLFLLLGSALIFTFSFILHEIGHKVAAQHYGLWAEFRLTLVGTLLTVFSVVSPIKIVSPGVVEMAGVADKKIIGKASLAGPATNLILSIVFLSLGYSVTAPFFLPLMSVGAVLNPSMALLNLIPFSVFDGEKIFSWNRRIWAVSLISSIVLTYIALRLFFAF